MLEVEKSDGKLFLVSDDAQAENISVADATEDTEFGMRWDKAEMKDGKVRVEVYPYEAREVADALAFHPETERYMDVYEEIGASYKERE